jgi:hypothetical protein
MWAGQRPAKSRVCRKTLYAILKPIVCTSKFGLRRGDRKMRKVEQERRFRGTRYPYAGWGLIVGASIGGFVGMLLLNNLALGAACGAGLGLVAGAALSAQVQAQVVEDESHG